MVWIEERRAVLKMPPFAPLEERFWKHVEKGIVCWVWTGSKTQKGYGRIGLGPPDQKVGSAHRVSWWLHFGPIPDGLFVLHHCDNPSCVRPEHLYLGTAADNTRDMFARGRHKTPFVRHERCRYGHPIDGADANGRYCKICRREYARRWRQQKKEV